MLCWIWNWNSGAKYQAEWEPYLDVERIKPSANNDFCIVTLEKNRVYDYFNVKDISPLCLPAEPGGDYDGRIGKVFGFGYTENFPDTIIQRRDADKMIERHIRGVSFHVNSTSKCYQVRGLIIKIIM